MNAQIVFKTMLSEIHKLLRMYLIIPIATATCERTFSAVRNVLTHKRSTMTQKWLNNCLLLYVHKDLTDNLDMTLVAKDFICNDERRNYFGKYHGKPGFMKYVPWNSPDLRWFCSVHCIHKMYNNIFTGHDQICTTPSKERHWCAYSKFSPV